MVSDSRLYQGTSQGFDSLQQSYFEYGLEVNTARSIPDVRDGLKPVQRRIIYAMHKHGIVGTPRKSASVVGTTMAEFHPHGDASIYDTLVNMTDVKGSWSVPVIKGAGTFGAVYTRDEAAKPRYTEACLNEWSRDYLGDVEYTDFVTTELQTGVEPVYLPVRYPSLLIPGHSGMGVGVSTNIPPFNFWDVIDLTETYVKDKSFHNKVIYPDFPTGGNLLADSHQAVKWMTTGSGTYKIRARYTVDGSIINVHEIPYGTVTEAMVEKILKLRDQGYSLIKKAIVTVGNQGCGVQIFCSGSSVVDEVCIYLVQKGVFQISNTSQMVWYDGKSLREEGVYSIIKTWYDSRKTLLLKKFTQLLEKTQLDLDKLGYFIKLINNTTWRDNYLDIVVNRDKTSAGNYLTELFPDIPVDVVSWIYERKASSFNKASHYQAQYTRLKEERDAYRGYLTDVDKYILLDLQNLKEEHAGHHERKSLLNNYDFKFSKQTSTVKEAAPQDTRDVTFIMSDNGFIQKYVNVPVGAEGYKIKAKANDILVGFDLNGRIVRVYGTDLKYGESVYLPKYLGTHGEENPEVLYLGLPGRDICTLITNEGCIKVFDPKDYVTNRKAKVLRKGVSLKVMAKLADIIPWIPQYLLMVDKSNRFIFTDLTTLPQDGDIVTQPYDGYLVEMNSLAYSSQNDPMVIYNPTKGSSVSWEELTTTLDPDNRILTKITQKELKELTPLLTTL